MVPADQFVLYSTSQSGLRFHKTVGSVVDSPHSGGKSIQKLTDFKEITVWSNYSPAPSEKFKKMWSFTSIYTYVFSGVIF
jgi:hypothetical protein